MRRRSINASMRAAALLSSESTKSRAGTRPLGSTTYSIVNSPVTWFLPPTWGVIALLRYLCQSSVGQIAAEGSTKSMRVKPAEDFADDVCEERPEEAGNCDEDGEDFFRASGAFCGSERGGSRQVSGAEAVADGTPTAALAARTE